MEIISRADAKARGLKRYFTGKMCKHGHLHERMVSSGGCIKCLLITSKQRDKDDPERRNRLNRDYYSRNAERIISQKRDYFRQYPEKLWKRNRAYYERNTSRARAASAKYRATRAASTLPIDKEVVRSLYELANLLTTLTGIAHQVDHIIPIGGRHVCGLHVERNLQVVPASYNNWKRNRFRTGRSNEEIDRDERLRLMLWEDPKERRLQHELAV